MQQQNNQLAIWRWARWGLLSVSLLIGAALVVSVWTSYNSIQRISRMVAHAEGYTLLNNIRRNLSGAKRRTYRDKLPGVLQSHKRAGLIYIGIFHPRGRPIASIGKPLGQTTFPLTRQTLLQESVHVGKRWRMFSVGLFRNRNPFWRRHRRYRRFRRLFPEGHEGTQRWRPIFPQGPPPRKSSKSVASLRRPSVLIIEFIPQSTRLLQAEARQTISISIGAALALLLVTTVFWFTLRRLSRIEEQRQQERQLALLGEMSAVLAHEIKNPLTSLKGHAQLLEEFLDEGSKLHAKAQRVVQETIRLEQLSHQLLDFVRTAQIDRVELDPQQLLREVIDSLEQETSSFKLELAQAPKSWPLDPTRMRQVLTNLLENAAHASPADKPVEVRMTQKKGQLLLTIRDQGEGIPEEHLASIFTPFFTTKTQGTGLGLAVAKRLVHLHHGTLNIENHPQGGVLCTIQIPPK